MVAMEQMPSEQKSKEKIEGLSLPPPHPEDIESPYFLSKLKERNGSETSRVEKHSLMLATISQHEDESDESYVERMLRVVDRFVENKLPHVAESLGEYYMTSEQKYLMPAIRFQNDVVRALSGLPLGKRAEGLVKMKDGLRGWFEGGAGRRYGDFRSEIELMLSGVHSVCEYIKMRRKKLGKKVQVYIDDSLDANSAIDLIEVVNEDDEDEDGGLIVRFIQSRNGGGRSEEKMLDSFLMHKKWVQEHLLGVHELLDYTVDLLITEAESERSKDLLEHVGRKLETQKDNAGESPSEMLVNKLEEIARMAHDLAQGIHKDAEANTQPPQSLQNESAAALFALYSLLKFSEESLEKKDKKWLSVAEEFRRSLKDRGILPVFGHPIKRFYSVYVVGGEPFEPVLIPTSGRFLGIEEKIN